MQDVLKALSKFNDQALSVHLVETSDALIEEQERVLCVYNSTETGFLISFQRFIMK